MSQPTSLPNCKHSELRIFDGTIIHIESIYPINVNEIKLGGGGLMIFIEEVAEASIQFSKAKKQGVTGSSPFVIRGFILTKASADECVYELSSNTYPRETIAIVELKDMEAKKRLSPWPVTAAISQSP